MSAPADFAIALVYPYVLPFVPGVPTSALNRAILAAADTILRRTRAWNVQLAPIFPDGVNTDFDLPVPTNGQITKLCDWSLNGVRRRQYTLEQATAEGLEPGFYDSGDFFDGPDGGSDGILNSPVAYLPNESQVRVLPLQTDTTLPIVVRVNLTVRDDATALPGVLTPYLKLIGKGALADLQSQPKKDYTNLAQSGVNEDRFKAGVGKLAFRAMRSFGAATVRRRPRTY
jgi:hypothetical protein